MAFFDKQGKNYFAKQLEIHGMEQYIGLEADSFNSVIIVRGSLLHISSISL